MRIESITETLRYVMTHVQTKFTIEFFMLTDDPHDQLRFGRRREGLLDGQRVVVPSPEDVLVQKIRWAKRGKRPKDREDALNIIESLTPGKLNLEYVRHWCDQHGSRVLLEQLLSEAKPPPLV